ncbi:hypothetical protein C8R43DRAFT_1132527 [Mycena crocata]|nr:hypothetical protein C8R43DRAFT_1132527 [Mycena crocata]
MLSTSPFTHPPSIPMHTPPPPPSMPFLCGTESIGWQMPTTSTVDATQNEQTCSTTQTDFQWQSSATVVHAHGPMSCPVAALANPVPPADAPGSEYTGDATLREIIDKLTAACLATPDFTLHPTSATPSVDVDFDLEKWYALVGGPEQTGHQTLVHPDLLKREQEWAVECTNDYDRFLFRLNNGPCAPEIFTPDDPALPAANHCACHTPAAPIPTHDTSPMAEFLPSALPALDYFAHSHNPEACRTMMPPPRFSPSLQSTAFYFPQDIPSGSDSLTPLMSGSPAGYYSLPQSRIATPGPDVFPRAFSAPAQREVTQGRSSKRRARRHHPLAPPTPATGSKSGNDMFHVGCQLDMQLSRSAIHDRVMAAKETSLTAQPSVVCQWDGCTDNIPADNIVGHLATAHGIDRKQADVYCRFPGCKREWKPMRGDSLAKHLRSGDHHAIKVQCTLCGEVCARPDALTRHLQGTPSAGDAAPLDAI